MGARSSDPVIRALEELAAALDENITASRAAITRIEEIKARRAAGRPFRQIADEQGRPLVVETITENLERLRRRGAALRRIQAQALHDEGLTMRQIAELFGVTRQRVSAILRSADG